MTFEHTRQVARLTQSNTDTLAAHTALEKSERYTTLIFDHFRL